MPTYRVYTRHSVTWRLVPAYDIECESYGDALTKARSSIVLHGGVIMEVMPGHSIDKRRKTTRLIRQVRKCTNTETAIERCWTAHREGKQPARPSSREIFPSRREILVRNRHPAEAAFALAKAKSASDRYKSDRYRFPPPSGLVSFNRQPCFST